MMENVSVDGMTVTGTESPIFVRLGHRGRGWTFSKNGADAFVAQNLLPGTYTITEAVDAQTGEATGENAPKGVYLLGNNDNGYTLAVIDLTEPRKAGTTELSSYDCHLLPGPDGVLVAYGDYMDGESRLIISRIERRVPA